MRKMELILIKGIVSVSIHIIIMKIESCPNQYHKRLIHKLPTDQADTD